MQRDGQLNFLERYQIFYNAIKFVDGSIKFYTELADDLTVKSKDFKFEPTKGDKEGIVKANDTEYELLELTVDSNASDLHISAGLPPIIRVSGELLKTELPALS